MLVLVVLLELPGHDRRGALLFPDFGAHRKISSTTAQSLGLTQWTSWPASPRAASHWPCSSLRRPLSLLSSSQRTRSPRTATTSGKPWPSPSTGVLQPCAVRLALK